MAWLVLFGGSALLVARVSVATVITIHGDGMAPTLLDSEQAVLLREPWSIERGDIVVYDPTPARAGPPKRRASAPPTPVGPEGPVGPPDVRRDPQADLRNTAVVDREELDRNWRKVQAKSRKLQPSGGPLRLARVLAVPGDKVAFHVPQAALGLSVNGMPIRQKSSDPIRIVLNNETKESTNPALRSLAYESAPARRYSVLVGSAAAPASWPGLTLPPATHGPVELEAEGYLVVADNRDEGACCDSRALGWIHADQIRGTILMRLAGDPHATPDLDPSSRGFAWEP